MGGRGEGGVNFVFIIQLRGKFLLLEQTGCEE